MPLDLAPELFIPAAALVELFRRRTLLGSANCLPVGFQKGGFPEGRFLGGPHTAEAVVVESNGGRSVRAVRWRQKRMNIGGLNTGLAAAQLKQLFGIEEIFKRRGLVVSQYERPKKLLFDLSEHEFPVDLFKEMHSTSFRRTVATVANAPDVCSALSVAKAVGITEDEALANLERAIQLRMIVVSQDTYHPARQVGFGATLEWYVAAVCTNDLGSIAYWGVEVENLSGDYDVVVVRDTQVGYIECKSGRSSNITRQEVESFLDREELLAPQFSVFLADGMSQERAAQFANYALESSREYEIEIPGVMEHGGTLEAENYDDFVWIIPINAFFVGVQGHPLKSTLRRIYQFLTTVCDRSVRVENRAAKNRFGLKHDG